MNTAVNAEPAASAALLHVPSCGDRPGVLSSCLAHLHGSDIAAFERAYLYSERAHAGQFRKDGKPYITHPLAVAEILAEWRLDAQTLIAALLHDVVEDTGVTQELVDQVFGPLIGRLVENLTDISKPTDGNRRTRKALDLAHTAKSDPLAKSVKLADLVANARDITTQDPDFARVWLREKAALLEVLGDGDPGLLALAYQTLNQCRAQLKDR